MLLLLLPPASSCDPGVVVMAAGVKASVGGEDIDLEGWELVGVRSELLLDEFGPWAGLSL